MPAPGTECIDYTPAKLIYAATGSLKEASERTGIGYSAVCVAAHRQDWKTEVQSAVEVVKQNVTTALGSARLSMQERSNSVREKHAKYAESVADKLSQVEPNEALMLVDTALKAAKHSAVTFGWAANHTVSVLTDVLSASGDDLECDVIDVEPE